jgi:peptidyl-dipeptidase A
MHSKILPGLLVPLALLAVGVPVRGAGGGDTTFRDEVRKYLTRYETTYQRLYTRWQEARWAAYTHIVPGDVMTRTNLLASEQLLRAFTGSIENIELTRAYLERRKELVLVEQRELDHIAWIAAGASQIVPDLVETRIAGDAEAADTFHGHVYEVTDQRGTDQKVDLHEIDRILREEHDLGRRRAAWDASKEVGSQLRASLVRLRWLRNEIVRAVGRRDFFAWRAAEYGFSSGDLMGRLDRVVRDLRPLQIELHTWARYELARRYGQPVPDLIPAHWLPSRFAEDWTALADVHGYDIDAALAQTGGPQQVVARAEKLWIGLGFAPLPDRIWERSSPAPPAADADFRKSEQASAWHIDLDGDVRVLMGAGVDERSWRDAHRVLGAVEYDLASIAENVPFTLRGGASRAFPDAIGMMIGLASEQPRCLATSGIEVAKDGAEPMHLPPMQLLLREALQYALIVPWSAGTMARFESEVYHDELPPERWNARYWELAAQYQGIAPPSPRDERWCDAAADPYLVDHPGDAYDRALACVLAFEMHDHIARKILYQDPHDTDYAGKRNVGDYLKSIMRFGATVDWRVKLREKTGYDVSARAMVDYFEPLRRWLVEQNAGRKRTLAPL